MVENSRESLKLFHILQEQNKRFLIMIRVVSDWSAVTDNKSVAPYFEVMQQTSASPQIWSPRKILALIGFPLMIRSHDIPSYKVEQSQSAEGQHTIRRNGLNLPNLSNANQKQKQKDVIVNVANYKSDNCIFIHSRTLWFAKVFHKISSIVACSKIPDI